MTSHGQKVSITRFLRRRVAYHSNAYSYLKSKTARKLYRLQRNIGPGSPARVIPSCNKNGPKEGPPSSNPGSLMSQKNAAAVLAKPRMLFYHHPCMPHLQAGAAAPYRLLTELDTQGKKSKHQGNKKKKEREIARTHTKVKISNKTKKECDISSIHKKS